MIRRAHRRLCVNALTKRAHPADDDLMRRSAVLFSPHFDDETLGAGGTIIQKRRSGALVHLVFMTDGSRSHARSMNGQQLSAVRRAEAIEAADALGVPEDGVTFLEFPELCLEQYRELAVDRIAALLSRLRCEEVFVPSTLEPLLWSSDHRVTTEVVFAALRRMGSDPEIYEYLVWFWYHWPWVPFGAGSGARQLLKLTSRNRFGLVASRALNTAVPIAHVLPEKRRALNCYKSQMTRLVRDKPWPVLGDVGSGQFLECFFQPNEFFRHYRFRSLHGDQR